MQFLELDIFGHQKSLDVILTMFFMGLDFQYGMIWNRTFDLSNDKNRGAESESPGVVEMS